MERHMRRACGKVLKRVEKHLSKYPMGETYFARVAAKNPLAVKNLRNGKIVDPRTLDKLTAFIEAREKELAGTPGGQE